MKCLPDFLYALGRLIREATNNGLCYLALLFIWEVFVQEGIERIFALALFKRKDSVHLPAHTACVLTVTRQAFANIVKGDVLLQLSIHVLRQVLFHVVSSVDFQVSLSLDDISELFLAHADLICYAFQQLIAALLVEHHLRINVDCFKARALELVL